LGTQMAVLVHELRQPLFAMKAFLDLERAREDGNSDLMDRLGGQIEHMERLISQYSNLSKGVQDHRAFDLNVPVGKTAEWMRPRAGHYGVTFRSELSKHSLPVIACPTSAQQITFNLIQNAYEAIRLGPGQGDVTVRTKRHGEWVRLEVEDTGGGLKNGVESRVTEPFVTTKEEHGGTGLGLYIVQTIVHSSRGEFRLVSSQKGVRAEVDLPCAA